MISLLRPQALPTKGGVLENCARLAIVAPLKLLTMRFRILLGQADDLEENAKLNFWDIFTELWCNYKTQNSLIDPQLRSAARCTDHSGDVFHRYRNAA